MPETASKPPEEKYVPSPEDIAMVCPSYWAGSPWSKEHGPIKLASGTECSFKGREYLREPLDCTIVERVAMKATGGGFPIDIATPVPTPSGWTTMEDIKKGDKVFGSDGKIYTVQLAHPVKYNQDCYRVTFTDKSSIVCDGDHLWTLTDMWHYRYIKQVTIKTIDIKNAKKRGNRNRYVLDVAKPLELPEATLPIAPYIFGLWLGDGNSYSAQMTCGVGDSGEYRELFKNYDLDYEIRDRWNEPYGNHKNIKFNNMHHLFRKMGVLANKHIPTKYLRASYEQRLELLRGLMDTDGHITKAGKCEWYNINKTLIDQVKELVLSLGAKAVVASKGPSMNWDHTKEKDYDIYRVCFKFYSNTKIANIKRKRKNQTLREEGHPTITERRRIISVEPVKSVPVRCITVDSPDHLFLAGEDFIPVHNSEDAILRCIHGCLYGRYPQGYGYYFPNDTEMQDYTKSRFDPLVRNNKKAIGRYIKKGGKSTDAAGLKRIGNSNLYLRGATMKPMDDGSRQSTKATGIQLDGACLDEVDQMEAEFIAKVRGRFGNACVDGIKGFHELTFLGNPSDEDRGVDLLWQGSDKRYWYRYCDCGAWTCAEKEFLDNPEKCVGFYTDQTERLQHNQPIGYIRCTGCGNPIGIRRGKWIITNSSVKTRAGWNWSHLTSEYHDPARILKDYRNPPENNFGDVMRLDLGLAYSSQDEKLRKSDVYDCCGNAGLLEKHRGPTAMGVDNDDAKHFVIGARLGNEKYEAFKMGRVDDFRAIYDLVVKFNVKRCVVDIRPNKDSAVEFAKQCSKVGCTVHLCEYTDSILQDAVFHNDRGIVKCYRTGIFDATHRLFANNHIIIPHRCATVDNFATQCCNCVKSKELNKRTRQTVFRYKKTGGGNDHLRNALNYFKLAADRTPRLRKAGFKLQRKCISE